LEIVRKLNIGLASQMPDQTERLKHILTKQVWGLERSPVPLLMTKAAFEKLFIDTTGIVGEVNVYRANALDGAKEIKDMKFDVVVGNPPYQAPQEATGKRGGGSQLWHKFAKLAVEKLAKEDGFVCFVHPSLWRKPNGGSATCTGMFKMMTHDNHMTYLSIHNTADGLKTFGAGTRYDWYVIQKGSSGLTRISPEIGEELEIDLSELEWLPNFNITEVCSLLGANGEIIYSASAYENRKPHMRRIEKSEGDFIYPIIHATTKKGISYCYSSRNDRGHFGVPKAIFGTSGLNDVVIDMSGEYGMTDNSIAIPIRDQEDGELLRSYLLGDDFKNILMACSWSNFRIEYRMFRDFKQGFWRAQNE